MAEGTIEIEATSPQEVTKKLESLIKDRIFPLSLHPHACPRLVSKGLAETTEAAFAAAMEYIPIGAVVDEKRELAASGPKVIEVEAFDERGAQLQAETQNPPMIVKRIKMVAPGKEGFLGIGKKRGRYRVEGIQPAIVEIVYLPKIRLSVDIAKMEDVTEGLIETLKRDTGGRYWGIQNPWSMAHEALVEIGSARVVELLCTVVKEDQSWMARSRAAEVLGDLGNRGAVELLIALLKDPDGSVRMHAANALGKLGDRRAVDSLIGALEWDRNLDSSDRGRVCIAAAQALGKLGDHRAVEPLITVLNNYGYVADSAAEALGELGDRRAVEPLMLAFLNTEGSIREKAANALARIDEDALARVRKVDACNVLVLTPDGKALYDLMHSSRKPPEFRPMTIQGTDRTIYYDDSNHRWLLNIPIDSKIRNKREIIVDPEQGPDRFVLEAFREFPDWCVGTASEGKVYRLITSGRKFDYRNPIIIGNLGYVYFHEEFNDQAAQWVLRVPISREGEKEVLLGQVSSFDEHIDEKIMNTIALIGLRRT